MRPQDSSKRGSMNALGASICARSARPSPNRVPGTRLDHLELEMIVQALDEATHVKARSAPLLGVGERNLWYKLCKPALMASSSRRKILRGPDCWCRTASNA